MTSAIRPPPVNEQIRLWVIDDPGQMRMVRASLLEVLTGQPALSITADDEVLQAVVIVATELMSNALQHGLPARSVRVGRGDGCLVVDVVDHELTAGPEYVRDRPMDRGGFGLRLVLELASDMGWCVIGASKHVWATIALAGRL
ncbi:ATP-binding protein [Actinoplanes sichuanensis]|uniref:ATP-binding protein n=1 Tax=Actinoplanes sichuanensis TaxID=512349 RepID=A0ABW4A1F1_9ACTN